MLIVSLLNSTMYCYILLLTLVCEHVWAASSVYYDLDNSKELFEDFISKYDKNYFTEEEKAKRFEIFKSNLEHINRMNKDSYDAVFAITSATDLTPEEFSTRNGLRLHENRKYCKFLHDEDVPNVEAPESLDWRNLSVVTPVKNQENCGSCWAFSTIGNIEGQYAIKHKQLVGLSEQQFLDCDMEDNGCGGGFPMRALEVAIQMKGIMAEKDYKYEATSGKCRADRRKAVANVTDCVIYDLSSQEKVKQLLYWNGPLSIGINSTGLFNHFSGIISDDQCNLIPSKYYGLDHAVLLVGYGTENNKPYWIVKNSWGASWQEGGYFRMQRNDTSASGACGMVNPFIATAVVA